MTVTLTCTHGMPTPASCTECMFDGNLPVAKRRHRVSRTVVAEHPGECRGCAMPIRPGELISLVDDHYWSHQGCA